MELNPRWALWLRTTNDPQTWEFMAWISERWREWERLNARQPHDGKTKADHADFDAWLRNMCLQ